MADALKIAVLEPYYGGSHAAFVDALKRYSRHDITLVTLPARKWKWRMRGAAIWFAKGADQWGRDNGRGKTGGGLIDLILCSDMLSVADLRALLPESLRAIPIVCYFHENQLTYPVPDEKDRDFQYGMTNITSCLAADEVWFNSRFHLEEFLTATESLLRKMPDYIPEDVAGRIRARSTVLSPPVGLEQHEPPERPHNRREPITILWSHRWEYDKNPEPFFDALLRLDEAGCPFNLVLLGEQFRVAPPVFASCWDRLEAHIVHVGFVPDHGKYHALLAGCDLVVSTAIQENFGIAVIEAVLAGCQPLLPNRLAYPEIIPEQDHEQCLYPTDDALFGRLRALLAGQGWLSQSAQRDLQTSLKERFGCETAVGAIDDALQRAAKRSQAQ